ncbi:MAG: alpha-L-fucosidase [Cyclobacteriaceae bacterium]
MIAALFFFLFSSSCISQILVGESVSTNPTKLNDEREQKMKWWREAKFGLFIHWGVYAVPAGMYKGEKVDRVSSWIMQHEHIPVNEYKEYADQFNPVKYDPEEWVDLAIEAGMKYLVITAKHHEGFSLYDSKVSDWDVVDSTPYGKDLLDPIIKSCREKGIRVGLYYSHSVDYVHPGGEVQSLDFKPGGQWDPIQKTKDMDTYFKGIVVPQVTEMLTNYGEIDLLWWDGGGWYNVNRERADMILQVTNEYPNLIMNNRLGGDYSGDWKTPEQYIPATGLDYDWETCMTMNDTWGYRSWDHNWKSTDSLIHMLVDVASKGGNFLLNIGPRADGTIPEASIERLKGIGRWMSVNSESIYGTTASPFENLPWGRCTKKVGNEGVTELYFHIFNWPDDGKLRVPRINNVIKEVYLLADNNKTQCPISTYDDEMIISLPKKSPNQISMVVRMNIEGYPEVMNPPVIDAEAGILYDQMKVSLNKSVPQVGIRYTINGTIPTKRSTLYEEGCPIILTENTTIKAALFQDGERVSNVRERSFTKESPKPANEVENLKRGLKYQYFEGLWSQVPDFNKLNPADEGIVYFFDVSKGLRNELFGIRFTGYIKVPETGVYKIHAKYNDGCNISIGEQQILNTGRGVVDSEIMRESIGIPIVLEKGFHPITVDYFQRIDHAILDLSWSGPDFTKQPINAQVLFHGD